MVPEDNDKKTVIALREIGEGKVLADSLEDSAVNKLRKNPEGSDQAEESGTIQEDDFDKIYKGEISKSGTAILPSKRVRQIPQKTGLIEKNRETKNPVKEINVKENESADQGQEEEEKVLEKIDSD